MPSEIISPTFQEQLLAACFHGRNEALQELLIESVHKASSSRSEGLSSISPSLITRMLGAATRSKHVETVEYILSTFPETTITEAVIERAIQTHSIEVYAALLAHDGEIVVTEFYDGRDSQIGRAVATQASPAFVEYLLSSGVSPNPTAMSPLCCLAIPEQENVVEKCKILLRHGAKIDGSGALPAAAKWGMEDLVHTLVQHGANANHVILHGAANHTWCPLHEAVEEGHLKIVKILLASGADGDILDYKGRTAMMIAREKDDVEIVRLLEAAENEKLTKIPFLSVC